MSAPHIIAPLSRRLITAAGVALVGALVVTPVSPAAAAAVNRRGDALSLSVTGISPATPVPSTALAPLSVQLSLTNTTGRPINHVEVTAVRGDPIESEQALTDSLAHPTPPTTSAVPVAPRTPVRVDVPAGSSVDATFTTTTSLLTSAGLCLCREHSVYPLFFSAHVNGAGGVDQNLGVAQTYLPAFFRKPANPVQVSWLWPLIDAPHRLQGTTRFTDDDLAREVTAPDGRLSRALQVVEEVGGHVPMTLLIDPELLDELEVMANGNYTVTSGKHAVRGTGAAAASTWLGRLAGVLGNDPQVQVELTPYADPDIQSLTRHGLPFAPGMADGDMRRGVRAALPGQPLDSSLAWPAAGRVSHRTLSTLAHDAVSTVLLDARAVKPRPAAGSVPAGLARLRVNGHDVAAALTSASIEKYAAAAVSPAGAGVGLPELLAEIAVQVAAQPNDTHEVVIAAPRYVDPSPLAAARAIEQTSRSEFTAPVSLHDAVTGDLLPTGRSRLAHVPARATTLPRPIIRAAKYVRASLPDISALLDHRPGQQDAAARSLLAGLPVAVQRIESAAWRQENRPGTGEQRATQLTQQVRTVLAGVHIVKPASRSAAYTLASTNSKLPVTVENDLPYPVQVQVEVSTVNGLPGFATQDIGAQSVEPNSKRTLHLPATIDRSGRILVKAQLLAPNGAPLGAALRLTVHSTALGIVGVIITIVAGAVLALALLVRLITRFRRRRREHDAGRGPRPPPTEEPSGPDEPIGRQPAATTGGGGAAEP